MDWLLLCGRYERRPPIPVHVIIGAAAEQRHELSWYETKPLFGWRVLVPRTKDQAAPMVARLRTYGAHSEEVPTISVEPPRSPLQMDKAIRGLVEGRYEWVAFTSVNAVRAVREKFEEYGLDARAFSGLKVAAVGEVTAHSLQAWGIEPDLVPEGEQSAAGLAAEFPPYDEVLDPINRVFLPRADIATETLAEGLRRAGLGGRGRDRLSHGAGYPATRRRCVKRSRPANSMPWSSRLRRRCATWSASPGSRMHRRSSRSSGRRRREPVRSMGCGWTSSPPSHRWWIWPMHWPASPHSAETLSWMPANRSSSPRSAVPGRGARFDCSHRFARCQARSARCDALPS